ncbi:major facilitator superfamily domain-containing protein [Xylariales sp. PMI_506]|nr:major facilitator superfamily domain-containing protein [Xylariales sp. PMI_506]
MDDDKEKQPNITTSSVAGRGRVRLQASPVPGGRGRSYDRNLCLKIDLRLLVPFVFLNFLSLMGRTNVGAALIQQLPQDLHLNAIQIFLVIAIPVVPLIVFEIPSNILMRWLEAKFRFSYMAYLSLITVLLGLVTLGQAFVKSYGAILATRFLVGVFDCGLIPGAVYVCSLYYPGQHLQWRLSMLMVANISSNIVSNILAYGIAHINNANGYHGWRWIFIIEGCLTMAIGLACCFLRISRPETASFLTEEERAIVVSTIRAQSRPTRGLVSEWKTFLGNPLNYVWAALYVFTCSTAYSIAIFAPSFVQAFNPKFTVPQVQGEVVPIFVVSAFACLATAWGADHFNHRFGFAITGYLISIVGYAILQLPHIISSSVTMFALYFVSIGVYIALPMIWTMTLVNLPTPFQRSIGCGFVVGIGNVAGFISAWIFRSSEAPRYHSGMQDGLILTSISVGLVLAAWAYIAYHNGKVDRAQREGPAVMEFEELESGDEIPEPEKPWKFRT